MKHVNCNLCNSDDFTEVIRAKEIYYDIDDTEFRYVRCNKCDLVYQNPQLTQEELEKHYPDEYGPYQDDFQLLKYSWFANFVKNTYHSIKSLLQGLSGKDKKTRKEKPQNKDEMNKKLLDFGCGSGVCLEKQRKKHPNWDFYGLEINPVACEKVREKGFDVFCGSIKDANLPNSYFDKVYMGHVIEHVNDPRQTLIELASAMKDGGQIKIETPNYNSYAAKIFETHWFALECPRHLFLFTPVTISKALKEAGFENIVIEFDDSPKVIIRSINYIISDSNRISFFFWHTLWYLLLPLTTILAKLGKTSVMTIKAKKASS